MEMLRTESKISQQTYLLRLVEEEIRERFPSLVGVGGLTIQTTFDLRLQSSAEIAVEQRLAGLEQAPGYAHPLMAAHREGDPDYLQAATVVLENYSGAIRALVGGRNFSHSEFNRATMSQRPMGSVFKPLVYGTAFERGLFPGMLVSDAAIAPGEIAWDRIGWNPQNSDGIYGGLMPVETGLIQSRNTMTARVGEWAGIESVLAMMEHAGLGELERAEPTPPLYIGTVGANVRDVTSAYSAFATGGIRHRPYFIESVTDRDGTLLYQHEDANYRVLSPGAAWLTSKLLKKVVADGGTGAGLRQMGFAAPAGGKTGTTNDFEDAWFVGYTSRLSCGVWIGLDQPANGAVHRADPRQRPLHQLGGRQRTAAQIGQKIDGGTAGQGHAQGSGRVCTSLAPAPRQEKPGGVRRNRNPRLSGSPRPCHPERWCRHHGRSPCRPPSWRS